jgi:hypothetical protein
MKTCLEFGTTGDNFGKNPIMRQSLIREVITISGALEGENKSMKDLVVTNQMFKTLA